MQRRVAFFRNMNLGQRRSNSPTSAQLLEAFAAAGATNITNFQTNGTVIFEADDAATVPAAVLALLREASGYADAVVVRSADWLVALAAQLDPDTPGGEVSLFDATSAPLAPGHVAHLGAGTLTVLAIDRQHAVTSWQRPDGGGGGANPVLTKALGVAVTCRGIPTMVRLATRLRALEG